MAEGIGIRNIIHQSVTSSHGQVYIEDVNSEGHTMIRHMYCEIPETTEPYASAKLITSEYYLLIRHVKEYYTMHHFGIPKHISLFFFAQAYSLYFDLIFTRLWWVCGWVLW